MLGPGLQGLVHLVKALLGGLGDDGEDERGEEPAELLLLVEADPTGTDGLDGEGVLAVEEPGDEQIAEPAQAMGWNSL